MNLNENSSLNLGTVKFLNLKTTVKILSTPVTETDRKIVTWGPMRTLSFLTSPQEDEKDHLVREELLCLTKNGLSLET